MYRVRLDQFEGPLDLLLFFIRRDELDVHDIPIARITDEFLAYVRLLEQIDLDGAADFIYMAALLIQIKARMLLPRPQAEGDEEPPDPRRELVERLLEYMRYKEAATLLDARWEARSQHVARPPNVEKEGPLGDTEEVTYRVSLFDLISALRTTLERTGAEEPVPRHTPRPYAYAIEDQRRYVLERTATGPVAFTALVARRPKGFIIVTFLAVLDLIQQQAVRLLLGVGAEDFAVEAVPSHAHAVLHESERERTRDLVSEREREDVPEPHPAVQAPETS